MVNQARGVCGVEGHSDLLDQPDRPRRVERNGLALGDRDVARRV
jgi:hypothetical protein